ncbi:MAG: GNAT family N-acetyltransferase [Lachnospiraceae bacterium]|nr:GNAT family N-acetyltransferase [Lachnospiraceae bacterium]
MYRNVWSQPESARYMAWKVTTSEEEAAGICLGSKFVGRGYGKQILLCLIRYCKEEFGAKEFIYSTRDSNKASIGLALSLGFQLIGTEEKQDKRDNQIYILQKYSLKI